MNIDQAMGWLRKLGNKYLGDGIHDSVRASEILQAIEDDRQQMLGGQAIEVEKMLCEALGRPWSPDGISVHSLIEEVKERLERCPATC